MPVLVAATERPLQLSLDDLRARERSTSVVTMECAGNGRALLDPRPLSQPWLLEAVGTARWSGVPVATILEEAGVHDDAVEVVFTGADRGTEVGEEQNYQRALQLAELHRPEVLLADEMNGAPLLPQHGAPVRLVTPGWYGMTNVKWLIRMTVVTEPFAGYQHERAYRMRADESDTGSPLSRIEPRSLMVPPGIPDFLSRNRTLAAGPVTVAGRAWSGWGPIAEVEVSVDGGTPGPPRWSSHRNSVLGPGSRGRTTGTQRWATTPCAAGQRTPPVGARQNGLTGTSAATRPLSLIRFPSQLRPDRQLPRPLADTSDQAILQFEDEAVIIS